MLWKCLLIIILLLSTNSLALLCYNCSATQRDHSVCGGVFVPLKYAFNNSRKYLVTCTGDSAMCFVRSWSARAQHSWVVQRGCYQALADDPLPSTLNLPTRSMTCKRERLPDADYQVCLCKADWCNNSYHTTSYTSKFINRMYIILLSTYIYLLI